jgi:DNA-directed RNA polymerase
MVQLMESWFLADKEKLAEFYGKDFHAKALSNNKNVEQVPKNDVISGLEKATQKTKKGKYGKGLHSGEVLKIIDCDKVRESAPHCERLFEIISKLTE